MMIRHGAYYIFLVFMVFCIASFCLNAALRTMDIVDFDRGRMDAKLDLYLNSFADSDIVFIGTSRTDRQVDIPQFEASMAAAGCNATAYNLGVQNLTYEENIYILQQIGQRNPKMIVMEEPIYAQHEWDKIQSDRLRFFSTWEGTMLRLRNIWTYQEDIARKLYRSMMSVAAFFYEQSNIGHLPKAIFPETTSRDEEILLPEILKANKGYVSMDAQGEVDKNISDLKARFLKSSGNFEARLDNFINSKSVYDTQPRARMLEDLKDMAANNAESVFFLFPPLPDRIVQNAALEKEMRSLNLNVLNTNDPDRYPQFFRASQWYDEGHLNAEASKQWSAEMADHICTAFSSGTLSEGGE